MSEFFSMFVLALLIVLACNAHSIPWQCLIGKHPWSYSGPRSHMVFREDRRGVTGGHQAAYTCKKCGATK